MKRGGGGKEGGGGGTDGNRDGGWGGTDGNIDRGIDGGGERSLWYLGSCQFFNFSSLFLREMSSPSGLGAFFMRSLATSSLPTSSSPIMEPTIGVSASNVDMSLKTSSKRFCLLIIILLIGSNFSLKLALLILTLIT